MKVFLHTRSRGLFDWRNELRDFARIPVVGEYFAWDDSSPWYQVQLVVHTPFEQADCEAEVYAIEVNHNEVKRRVFYDAE
jgi:hypothetical protein